MCVHQKTCTRVFIETQFLIAPRWKWPKYVSTVECLLHPTLPVPSAGVYFLISHRLKNLLDLQVEFPLNSKLLADLLLTLFKIPYTQLSMKHEGMCWNNPEMVGRTCLVKKLQAQERRYFIIHCYVVNCPQMSGLNKNHGHISQFCGSAGFSW